MKEIKRNKKKGFTLVELIVVIVILGILMAIAIPNVIAYIDKANVKADGLAVRNVYLAACTVTAEAYAKRDVTKDFALAAADYTEIENLAGLAAGSVGGPAADGGTNPAYTITLTGNEVTTVVLAEASASCGKTVTYDPAESPVISVAD